MTVRIRPASVSDAAAIARLTTELGYPTSTDDMRFRLETLLPRDSQYIAVAESATEIVGWIAVEHRVVLESGTRAEIVGLVVAESARRSGAGSALVGEGEEWARQRGHRVINVRSNVARREAHPFYERLGYVRTKTQHAYRKDLAPGG
jgi:ribosomal protein S18 acetylase RimI-like enzyme